ncbi:MAG: hypothetical protein HUK22_07980 [Thermoguttaceae bacterium]|nr:hypothetical protein [Thermoguttaceae bacterium]
MRVSLRFAFAGFLAFAFAFYGGGAFAQSSYGPGGAPGAGSAPNAPQNPASGAPGAPNANSNAADASAASENLAEKQLAPLFQLPAANDQSISCSPLALEKLLYGVASPAERYRRLRAYWDFSEKFASYNAAVAYSKLFDQCLLAVQTKRGSLDSLPTELRASLAAGRLVAKERVNAAKLIFQKNQYDFDAAFSTPSGRAFARSQSDAKIGSGGAILYAPSAVPATGRYKTRYEEMSQTRRLSLEAARLSVALPLASQALESRAQQTTQAYANLNAAFSASVLNEAQLFAALDAYAAAREELLAAAIRYNQAIAAYVAETVPANVDITTLLAAIGQRPSASTAVATGSLGPYEEQNYASAAPTGDAASQTALSAPASGGVLASSAAPEQSNASDRTVPLVEASYTKTDDAEAKTDAEKAEAPASETNGSTPAPAGADSPTPPAPPSGSSQTPPTAPAGAGSPTPPAPPSGSSQTPPTAPAGGESSTPPAPPSGSSQTPPTAPAGAGSSTPPAPPSGSSPTPPANDSTPPTPPTGASFAAFSPSDAREIDADVPATSEPFVIFVTGFEQPSAASEQFAPPPSAPTEPRGAFAKLDASEWIVRGQELEELEEPGFAPRRGGPAPQGAPPRESAPQGGAPTPTAGQSANSPTQTNAANAAVELRIAETARALFQSPGAVTDGAVRETATTLRDVVSRVPQSSRKEAVRLYWVLKANAARLEVERKFYAVYAQATTLLSQEVSSGMATEEQSVAAGAYLAAAREAQARVAEATFLKRDSQISLARFLGGARDFWPEPTTSPYCRTSFNLSTPSATNFTLNVETAMIPEKLKSLSEIGATLGAPAAIFSPETQSITEADPIVTLTTLAKKRESAMLFIELVISLNISIGDYVAEFPGGRVSADRFVTAIGAAE